MKRASGAQPRAWKSRIRQARRRLFRWLLRLRGSPRAIAGGVAVGMLVSFTPTLGFQTLLALALATACNVNRPAAIPPTWITNPITVAPIFAFTYAVGSALWPGPDSATVAHALGEVFRDLEAADFLALRHQLAAFANLGFEIFVPLWIGGLLVGGAAAAVSYWSTLRGVERFRAARLRRKHRRRRAAAPARDTAGPQSR